MRHPVLAVIGAIILIAVIASIASSGGSPNSATSGTAATADGNTESLASSTPSATTPPAPEYTVAEENAIRSAQAYVNLSGFSRRGLIEQLSSKAGEGFKKRLAVFAVNHIQVNWYQEAVQSAKSYLKLSGFSRSGLIEQLSSKAGEQFTLAQAKYAANHVGL